MLEAGSGDVASVGGFLVSVLCDTANESGKDVFCVPGLLSGR